MDIILIVNSILGHIELSSLQILSADLNENGIWDEGEDYEALGVGVGCVECHGRIDQMEVVYQAESLSMAWCLDCHKEPEKFLRPKDKVTQMDYKIDNQEEIGLLLKEEYHINPGVSCSVCHR